MGALLLAACGVLAQDRPETAPTPEPTPQPVVAPVASPKLNPPPSPDEAMRSFVRVEGWVRGWSLTGEGTGPAVDASAVTLRLDGVVIGRGVDVGGGTRSLQLSAGAALSDAAERLPIEHDALFEQNRRLMADRILISVELAGSLIPISPAEYADASLELAPGLDGVAVRFGDRVAAMFPGLMLERDMDPARALAATVSRASGDPTLSLKRPADLAKEEGAVFYRFRVTHLAHPAVGEPALFLSRGGRVFEKRQLGAAELERWAAGMAENLMRRRWPGVERYGLQGTFDPVSGQYESSWAPPAEQAVAIRALCAAAWVGSADHSAARVHPAAVAARALLEDLLFVEEGEVAPWNDPVAAAATLRAAIAVGRLIDAPGDAERVARLRVVAEGAFDAERGWSSGLPGSGCAMIAEALADGSPDAEAALRSLYRDAGLGGLVNGMPWLGFAELAMAGNDRVPGAAALREMRSLVNSRMLTADVLAPEARDLAGGIVFNTTRNPMPTAQSARPLAFHGRMLGDDRLTEPGEVAAEVGRLLEGLRFLRQLTAGDAEGHMYARPERARWGVRGALWDQRMRVDATATTLLAVCETIRSLQAIQRATR